MEEKADFAPLVRFMEKIAMNPQEHSREQLFTWLQNNNFTIDSEGDIIAYKGVNVNSDNVHVSTHRGPAIVNGEEVNGYVPQPDGAVIEMPRSQVVHDPHNACSRGLHLSGWAYAQSYGTVRLQVKVNPRDIVSVPTHDGFQKVRCCRYTVIGKVTKPVTTAYLQKAAPKVTLPTRLSPAPAKKAVKAAKPATVGYAELTLKGLRDAAQKRQIRVQGRRPSHCSKAELVKALKADDRKIARRATSKKK
jgi:hypothetical protein